MFAANLFVCVFPQLQSNLIPGLNLNALGLFPSGTTGAVSPSMAPGSLSGVQAGYPSFGVSVNGSSTLCLMSIAHTYFATQMKEQILNLKKSHF